MGPWRRLSLIQLRAPRPSDPALARFYGAISLTSPLQSNAEAHQSVRKHALSAPQSRRRVRRLKPPPPTNGPQRQGSLICLALRFHVVLRLFPTVHAAFGSNAMATAITRPRDKFLLSETVCTRAARIPSAQCSYLRSVCAAEGMCRAV